MGQAWTIETLKGSSRERVGLEGEFRGHEFGTHDRMRAFRRFALGVLEQKSGEGVDLLPVRVALARLNAKVGALAGLLGPMEVVELGVILTEAERLLLANLASSVDPVDVAVERTLVEALARVTSMARRRNLRLVDRAIYPLRLPRRANRAWWGKVTVVGGRAAA